MITTEQRLRIIEALAKSGVHFSMWSAEAARIERYIEAGPRDMREEIKLAMYRDSPKT